MSPRPSAYAAFSPPSESWPDPTSDSAKYVATGPARGWHLVKATPSYLGLIEVTLRGSSSPPRHGSLDVYLTRSVLCARALEVHAVLSAIYIVAILSTSLNARVCKVFSVEFIKQEENTPGNQTKNTPRDEQISCASPRPQQSLCRAGSRLSIADIVFNNDNRRIVFVGG